MANPHNPAFVNHNHSLLGYHLLQEYLDWFANLKKTYVYSGTSCKQMVYAAYDETTRTFSYKPYENWATRRF